jgi:hypothetical protein
MTEAFVYLWYDAPNKMYYLGSHKGSPEDSYTHSSTKWESFTKDNIPEGVTRRILAYGTDEEMCILEHELLVNRKKRCWNRYYNNSLGDPRYVDMSGENNPMYGKGAERTGENNPMYGKTWGGRRAGENNPNWKGGITNDMKEYDKKRSATPERKAYQKEYQKKYQQTPENKAYMKEYRQTPEYKAYHKKYNAEWYARKKAERQAEKQGVGTLDAFLK